MFFKRRRRNRRHTKDYVLDVKLSVRQRRQGRLRRLSIFVSFSVVLSLTGVGVWRGGELAVDRFLKRNPAFEIRHIEVSTDGVISKQQIQTWAGVKVTDNLWALDLGGVERDLKLISTIESVVVERVFPRTIRIRVIERDPIARVAFTRPRRGGGTMTGVYNMDAWGYFMVPVAPHQRAEPRAANTGHLPFITGIPSGDVRPGRAVETAQVRSALAFIQAFEGSAMAGLVDLREVDVAGSGVLIVRTWQENELTLRMSDFGLQLRRWHLVHQQARRFGKQILKLDLAVENNAPLVWKDLTSSVSSTSYRKDPI